MKGVQKPCKKQKKPKKPWFSKLTKKKTFFYTQVSKIMFFFVFFVFYIVFDHKSWFFLLFTMFLIKFLKNVDIQKTETKIWLFNVLHLFGMPLFEHVFCLTPINNFVIYKLKKVNTKKQTIQRIRLNLHFCICICVLQTLKLFTTKP